MRITGKKGMLLRVALLLAALSFLSQPAQAATCNLIPDTGQIDASGSGCPGGYIRLTYDCGPPGAQTLQYGGLLYRPLRLDPATFARGYCLVLKDTVESLRFDIDEAWNRCNPTMTVTPPAGTPQGVQVAALGGVIQYGSNSGASSSIYAPAGIYLIDVTARTATADCATVLSGVDPLLWPNQMQLGVSYSKTPGFTPTPGGPVPPSPAPAPSPPPVSGSAGVEPGCDPEQLKRMREYAEGHVLREVAIIEEEIEKPDSTQILTCLDKGFGESAKAGKIFSDVPTEIVTDLLSGAGSGLLGVANILTGFIPGLGNVALNTMGNALGYVAVPAFSNFIENFFGSLGDLLSDIVGGSLGAIFSILTGPVADILNGLFGWLFGGTDDFECDAMGKLWDEIIGSGINPEYTYFTYDEFLRAELPTGTGVVFEQNTLEGEGPAIRQKSMDAATTMTPGDGSGSIPYYLKAPDFLGSETPADVISKF